MEVTQLRKTNVNTTTIERAKKDADEFINEILKKASQETKMEIALVIEGFILCSNIKSNTEKAG